MIEVTRFNGKRLMINGDHIEKIEATPDTIISLISGRKLLVRETVEEMVEKLTFYRRSLLSPPIFAFDETIREEVMSEAVL